MSAYLVTIGLEIHAHILTASKMFDGCPANYAGAEPNTFVSVVSLGLPGTLPVVNQAAVERAALTGLALNCRINERSVFSRKSYIYPDLVKGYQISQYDEPLCSEGWIEIRTAAGATKRIGIERLHIEEDTGRLSHAEAGTSLIDYNRAGMPLMEIVSCPELETPEEARLYFEKMRQILVWIGVNSGNLEEGALRCDANVSVRPVGQQHYGAKVEIKNINSYRYVERALAFEIKRQIALLQAGGVVHQETRGWDELRGETVGQRSKEFAHDYRYFPEPDIPPIVLDATWMAARQAELPELPDARRMRFMEAYGLNLQDADLLTLERSVADYYEAGVAAAQAIGASPKEVANWVLNEGFRLLKDRGEAYEQLATRVPVAHLAEIINLVAQGSVTRSVAKQVFEESFDSGQTPAAIVKAKGLTQISDSDAMRSVVQHVLADPKAAKAIAEYRGGKTSAVQFLVGMVMKATKGQANPHITRTLLEEELAAS
ncbi:Asp-tRNA(Asn)/Glu-tRNA(Gln) amidotransferase subunit GatB [Candidatus Viridilinea mediisalina]|uniref:Aspartyl/glutamyl-tRNA(Asn/Gln) amidotransferase subunit B n=1 Tax=Candidatus Viridilinea mediisalina TaxID=2024553 RepID=A0A2A6RNQ9_9CHLR|nr:Asp-tRNA(Asn)/Glu-tRNA(Gln) amidotransferase subunit GatB [Candidatus Viridilinea mediisalina]PDW04531.1 Asp-tRNA(Asn)/Glu-tRNA(Gln) amidotransferase GatCAB subunit B [Candidatus Viridilinea mediisalina]